MSVKDRGPWHLPEAAVFLLFTDRKVLQVGHGPPIEPEEGGDVMARAISKKVGRAQPYEKDGIIDS